MSKVFEKPEDLGEYLFRITDNGGASVDRYTVVFSDGSYLGLSGNPTSPVGFSQWGERIDVESLSNRVESGEEIDLALGDLSAHLVQHILGRSNEGLADFLEAVDSKKPRAVAKNRDDASANEGISTSLGDGIYWTEAGYMVKQDGPVEDDFGPYTTAREAIINTLPCHYGLSGPEYHSTVNEPSSLDKTEGVANKIAELEAKLDEASPSIRI